MRLLLVWMLNAAALIAVTYIVPGISLNGWQAAFIAALVLGLLNMLVKPILLVLTLPITIITLGLFYFVLNALLFWFAGSVLNGFHVTGFVAALLGALLYSL